MNMKAMTLYYVFIPIVLMFFYFGMKEVNSGYG